MSSIDSSGRIAHVHALRPRQRSGAGVIANIARTGINSLVRCYGSARWVWPRDLYTFYDETPLLTAGTNGGGGNCIALPEVSDFNDTSVSGFDQTFGLATANITRVLVDGSNPGKNSAETEALLDIEWSHTVAPGAPIRVYIGNSAASTDPLLDAIKQAVRRNTCGSISISFGYCGAAASFFTSTLDSLFAQAASQGHSVFVATGDDGAAGGVLNPATNACAAGHDRQRQRDAG